MAEAKKFLFNNRDLSDHAIEAQRKSQGAAPPPVFSEHDVEISIKRAHKNGLEEGIRQQKESVEQALSILFADLSRQIDNLATAEAMREGRYERDAVALAAAILTRLYPLFEERLGGDQLISDLETILAQARGQEAIIISVHPEMVEGVRRRFENGEQAVQIQSDATLGQTDARVTWARGGAQIVRGELLADMEALLARALEGEGGTLREDAGVPGLRVELDAEDHDIGR